MPKERDFICFRSGWPLVPLCLSRFFIGPGCPSGPSRRLRTKRWCAGRTLRFPLVPKLLLGNAPFSPSSRLDHISRYQSPVSPRTSPSFRTILRLDHQSVGDRSLRKLELSTKSAFPSRSLGTRRKKSVGQASVPSATISSWCVRRTLLCRQAEVWAES